MLLLHGVTRHRQNNLPALPDRKDQKGALCFAQYRGGYHQSRFYPAAGGNPNSVLIIEDAENVIMDRKLNNSGSVSRNLLNISDGLLADFLNVQFDLHLQQSAHPGRPGADAERKADRQV